MDRGFNLPQIGPYVLDYGPPFEAPLKVDKPHSFTYLDHTPTLSGMWLGVGQDRISKSHVY